MNSRVCTVIASRCKEGAIDQVKDDIRQGISGLADDITRGGPLALRSNTGNFALGGMYERSLTVTDTDDQATQDILAQSISCANGQEAPDNPDLDSFDDVAHWQLPLRQREEAAKLAERRRRFDNRRYSRDRDSLRATVGSYAATMSMPSVAGHQVAVGLNPTSSNENESHDFSTNQLGVLALPGSVGRTPSPVPRSCKPSPAHSKHVFDDDDELLMNEILQTAEVASSDRLPNGRSH